jgi:hypothetical protein
MYEKCSELLASPTAKYIYAAVVVLALVLIVMRVASAERLENPNYLYTSGATQRFQQEDTSANRGDYTTGYNFQAPIPAAMQAEVNAANKAAADAKARRAARGGSENLTAYPDEPDLWAVGQDLYAYKNGITGQTRGLDTGRHGMGMKNMTTERMQDDMYESLLQQQALVGA